MTHTESCLCIMSLILCRLRLGPGREQLLCSHIHALFFFRWLLLLNVYMSFTFILIIDMQVFFGANWSSQEIMEQLMAKGTCGGICGEKRHSLSQDLVSWSWWILQMLSCLIWFSKIHHFGTSILFTAGRLWQFTGNLANISLWLVKMQSLDQHQSSPAKFPCWMPWDLNLSVTVNDHNTFFFFLLFPILCSRP